MRMTKSESMDHVNAMIIEEIWTGRILPLTGSGSGVLYCDQSIGDWSFECWLCRLWGGGARVKEWWRDFGKVVVVVEEGVGWLMMISGILLIFSKRKMKNRIHVQKCIQTISKMPFVRKCDELLHNRRCGVMCIEMLINNDGVCEVQLASVKDWWEAKINQ